MSNLGDYQTITTEMGKAGGVSNYLDGVKSQGAKDALPAQVALGGLIAIGALSLYKLLEPVVVKKYQTFTEKRRRSKINESVDDETSNDVNR